MALPWNLSLALVLPSAGACRSCLIPSHLCVSLCSTFCQENVSLLCLVLLQAPVSVFVRVCFPQGSAPTTLLPSTWLPLFPRKTQTPFPGHETHPSILPSSLSCIQSPGSPDTPVGIVLGLGSKPVLAVLTPGTGSQALLSRQCHMHGTGKLIGLQTQFLCLKVQRKKCVHSGESGACRISYVCLRRSAHTQPQAAVSAPAPRPWPGPLATAACCHSLATSPLCLMACGLKSHTGFPQGDGGSNDGIGVPGWCLFHLCFGSSQPA